MSEQEQQDLRDQTRTRLTRAAVQLAARSELAERLTEPVEALGFGCETAPVVLGVRAKLWPETKFSVSSKPA